MPPSRELTIVVNEAVKAKLEEHLRLSGPCQIVVRSERQNRLYGMYEPHSRTVTIHLGSDILAGSHLLHVNRKVIETLLHEFRHAHQYDNWDPEKLARDERRAYHLKDVEEDANDWSSRNVSTWIKLARVSRKSPSVFGAQNRRLAAAGVGR
jgi:hypothetical protein